MFYQRKKKEKKNSKPTNLFELYICIQQAIVCGWMMIIDVVNFLSNIFIYVSPCICLPSQDLHVPAIIIYQVNHQDFSILVLVLP